MSDTKKQHGGAREGAGRHKSPSVMVRVPEGCLGEVRSFIDLYRKSISEPDQPNDTYWIVKGWLS